MTGLASVVKNPRLILRDQLVFTTVLILLTALGLFLLFKDPRFFRPEKSRVDWPPPASVKP